MTKPLQSFLVMLLAVSPALITVVWHVNNHGWPNDDAANYMLTAFQQYRAFDGSVFDGLRAMYQIRGWRPIFFPLLTTPFLLLFNGSVLAAVGATLSLCCLISQGYIYAIARRYLDPLRASFVAAFVGSSHAIASQGTVFFAEIAWLAFFAGFIFYILDSENFCLPNQSTLAGIFLGFATLVRPAETLAISFVPLISVIVLGFVKKQLSVSGAVSVMSFALLSATPLLISLLKPLDYRWILAGGLIIAVAQLWFVGRGGKNRPGLLGFNLFSASFMLINLVWWAPSMPQLCSWVYDTSFGAMAQITDVAVAREGVFSILHRIFSYYLFPEGFLIASLALLSLLPLRLRFRSFDSIKTLAIPTVVTVGLLVPMCILYAVTGTSDPRRVFIGMSFLLILLAIFALQDGPVRSIRLIAFALITALQLTSFLSAARVQTLPLGNLAFMRPNFPMPKVTPDRNEALIARLLELGVPKGSVVAVYTMALFEAKDRIYEPAALQLAAATMGSDLRIIYYWDTSDYSSVMERLRKNRATFLLIDKYRSPENGSSHMPSQQFSAELLDRTERSNSDLEGLKEKAIFKLGGRDQILFDVQ